MKNFRLNIVIRILIICATLLLINYLYLNTELTLTIIILSLVFLYEIISLINSIDLTNKELTRFVLSIKHSDFSQSFHNTSLGKSFTELFNAFNEVMDKFRNTRNEKEEHLKYLQTVTQHVAVGLISFNQTGDVEFINSAAKKLLRIPYLKNIINLNNLSDSFGTDLMQMQSGDKITVKIVDNDELIQLIIMATEFKMRDQVYRLVSLQNIQSELDEKEMDAWQKLIRVLTHEIMNSITPISSLSATVNHMLENPKLADIQIPDEIVTDIKDAVSTIHKRSDGLIKFVNNYRNLTKLPKPNFEIISIEELFGRINKLIMQRFDAGKIKYTSFVEPKSLELTADPELIEQVLINLLINSIHAVNGKENPEITMNAKLDERGKIVLRVIDNGVGISKEVLEKIFIPFYSTKKDGSGIGLSLSRQIIRSHGGNIGVNSIPGKETIFTLRF